MAEFERKVGGRARHLYLCLVPARYISPNGEGVELVLGSVLLVLIEVVKVWCEKGRKEG